MANEVDLNLGTFDLDSGNSIAVADIDLKVQKALRSVGLPRSYGSVAPIEKRKEYLVTLRGTVIGANYDTLRTNLDNLKNAVEGTVYKRFTTDDDRYLEVQYRDFSYSWRTIRTFAEFAFTLVAPDPFWLAITATTANPQTWTTGVGFTVTNNGNAPTRLKITLTAPGSPITNDIKFENTTTGEIFIYRGTLAASQVLIVNNRVDDTDIVVTNNAVDDIQNFEGDFTTLNSGANTCKLTSASSTATLRLDHRDAYW